MQMTTGRKSPNLVKSHELICHFIRMYLSPLPPYFESSIFVDCSACDVTSEPWGDSGSFCDLTKQKVGCLVKFRPCLTFYELKELKKCLLKDLENGMSAYEDKQLLKSCSIYKELFVKWA